MNNEKDLWINAFFGNLISQHQWYELPFNGQVRRCLKILQILSDLNPDSAVETGTYLGTTTEFLTQILSCKVHTIEVVPENADTAIRRFEESGCKDLVDIRIGDSSIELPKILDELSKEGKEKLFTYLDAHWESALPLKEELRALESWDGACIAVVDDFKIPDRQEYGFDTYDTSEVSAEYLGETTFELWLVDEDSRFETGARRGTAYLINEKAKNFVSSGFYQNLVKIN